MVSPIMVRSLIQDICAARWYRCNATAQAGRELRHRRGTDWAMT
jgi:hypothetical protein